MTKVTFALITGLFLILGIQLFHIQDLKVANNLLETQRDTLEPELPSGVTTPLTPETVMVVNLFCSSWEELISAEGETK